MIVRINTLAKTLMLAVVAGFYSVSAFAAPFNSGDILVVDNNSIYLVDPGTGTRTLLSSGGDLVNDTRSALFESSTSILALNAGGKVVRISDTGVQTLLADTTSEFRDFTLSADKLHVYAGDIGTDEEIWRYTMASNTWQKLTPGSAGDGSNFVGGRTYFDEPYQPQVVGTNLFVAERDSGSGQLVRVDLTGTAPNMAQTILVNNLGGSRGLEVHSSGDLIVTSNSGDSILRYTQAGSLVGTISSGGLISEPYHLVWKDNTFTTLLLADSNSGLIEIDFALGTQTLLGPADGIFGVDVFLLDDVVDPVPEPSTYALALLGLAGLGIAAARRRGARRKV